MSAAVQCVVSSESTNRIGNIGTCRHIIPAHDVDTTMVDGQAACLATAALIIADDFVDGIVCRLHST